MRKQLESKDCNCVVLHTHKKRTTNLMRKNTILVGNDHFYPHWLPSVYSGNLNTTKRVWTRLLYVASYMSLFTVIPEITNWSVSDQKQWTLKKLRILVCMCMTHRDISESQTSGLVKNTKTIQYFYFSVAMTIKLENPLGSMKSEGSWPKNTFLWSCSQCYERPTFRITN